MLKEKNSKFNTSVGSFKSQQKPNDDDKGTGGPKDSKPEEKENVVDADFEDVKEDKEKKAPKIKNGDVLWLKEIVMMS